jgi:hypothetical protein
MFCCASCARLSGIDGLKDRASESEIDLVATAS